MKRYSLLIGLLFFLGCFSFGALAQDTVDLAGHDRLPGLKILNEGFSTDDRLYFRVVGDQENRMFLIQVEHLETGRELVIPAVQEAAGVRHNPDSGYSVKSGVPGGSTLVHMGTHGDWSSYAVMNGGSLIGFLHVSDVTGDTQFVSIQ